MDSSPQKLPKWLAEQQFHSWQIEILIASGLVYFLSQVPDYLRQFFTSQAQASGGSVEETILLSGGISFSQALLMGFVVNLILRAIWLAYLGINFSFPKGINYQQLGYDDFFNLRNEERKSLVDRILTIEKLCSLSYSVTIIMTLVTLGAFWMLLLTLWTSELFTDWLYNISMRGGVALFLFWFVVMLGGFDYLFFRLLPGAARWYYPIHRILNIIALRFLYNRELTTLISHTTRWKVHLTFLMYITTAFFLTFNEIGKYTDIDPLFKFDWGDSRGYARMTTRQTIDSDEYCNRIKKGQYISSVCVDDEIIKSHHLPLFVVYRKWMDKGLDYFFEKNGVLTERDTILSSIDMLNTNDSLVQVSFDEFFEVEISKRIFKNLKWYYHRHPTTQELGFRTHVPLDSIPQGIQEMELFYYWPRADTLSRSMYRFVPFVKDY